MKIARVVTNGVRGLPDRTFDLVDGSGAPARRVLIVGPPGCGKTRFLETLVAAKEDVGPYGVGYSKPAVRPGAAAAKVTIHWELEADDTEQLGVREKNLVSESIFGSTTSAAHHDARLELVLRRYAHGYEHGKLEYVPALRTLSPEAAGSMSLDPDDQKALRPERSFRKYSALPKFLSELGLGLYEPERASHFAAMFAALTRTKRVAGVRRTNRGPEMVFAGVDDVAIGISELSASEQQALIFAGMAALIGLSHSVVLVDGPELFLPSDAVPAFVDKLSELGIDNQWIFATSNRELIDAGADLVIDLTAGEKRSGDT